MGLDGSRIDDDTAAGLFDSLAKLWLFADRVADSMLRNTAMESMICLKGQVPMESRARIVPPAIVHLIWSTTTSGRAIRGFVLDFYAAFVSLEDMPTFVDEIEPDFKEDLMLVLTRNREGRWLSILEHAPCYYCEHDEYHPSCPLKPAPFSGGDTLDPAADDSEYSSESDSVGYGLKHMPCVSHRDHRVHHYTIRLYYFSVAKNNSFGFSRNI